MPGGRCCGGREVGRSGVLRRSRGQGCRDVGVAGPRSREAGDVGG